MFFISKTSFIPSEFGVKTLGNKKVGETIELLIDIESIVTISYSNEEGVFIISLVGIKV